MDCLDHHRLPLTTSVAKTLRRGLAVALLPLLLLVGNGCTVECMHPGVVVKSDWALEFNNRSKANKKGKKKSSESDHPRPCGKFGCLKCALGPSSFNEELEDEDEKCDSNTCSTSKTASRQGYPYPPGMMFPPPGMYGPGLAPPPFLAGGPPAAGYGFQGSVPPPGMFGAPLGAPLGAPASVAVVVINPGTGQRQIMQPAVPGGPSVTMLNAMTGQPVLVNPNPPGSLPQPTPQAPPQPLGGSAGTLAVAPQLPPSSPGAAAPLAGPVPQASPQLAYGMPPPQGQGLLPQQGLMGAYGIAPLPAPGYPAAPGMPYPPPVAMLNPATGLPMPVPPPGYYPPGMPGPGMPMGMPGYPPAGYAAQTPGAEEAGKKNDPKSSMPTPRYHGLPTHPVYQRTEGLALEEEESNDERARREKLEKALGVKIPQGTNIASNGINQRIVSPEDQNGRGIGGGPANGSPFYQFSGMLGLNGKENPPTAAPKAAASQTAEEQVSKQAERALKARKDAGETAQLQETGLESEAMPPARRPSQKKKEVERPQESAWKFPVPSLSRFVPTGLLAPSAEVQKESREAFENAQREEMKKAAREKMLAAQKEEMKKQQKLAAKRPPREEVATQRPKQEPQPKPITPVPHPESIRLVARNTPAPPPLLEISTDENDSDEEFLEEEFVEEEIQEQNGEAVPFQGRNDVRKPVPVRRDRPVPRGKNVRPSSSMPSMFPFVPQPLPLPQDKPFGFESPKPTSSAALGANCRPGK